MKLEISELGNLGDTRGFSFTLPPGALDFLKRVADLHMASIVPGAVRGNHYHLRRREAIVVLPGPAWSLHWDDGEGLPVQHRRFQGNGAVLVLVSGAQRWRRSVVARRLFVRSLRSCGKCGAKSGVASSRFT